MEQIQSLLADLDWFNIGSTAIAFLFGLSFISGIKSKAKKLSKDVAHIVNQLNDEIQQEDLSKDDIKDLVMDLKQLVADFKA